ncbi:MAG: hypothetical protein MI725_07735 [Pirellulales bacterium]|nr:hypothetical protein [Pirellulales bacterium]
MNDFKDFGKQIAFSFVLPWLIVGFPETLLAKDVPTSVEELDPETRKQFKSLYAKWQETQQAIEAAEQRAYRQDPLLEKAIIGLQRAKELEAKSGQLRTQANLYYQKQDTETEKRLRQWDALYGEVEGVELFEQTANDQEFRPYMVDFFAQIAQEMVDNADIEDLSREEAFDRYLEIAKQGREQNLEKYAELKKSLTLPEPIIEYVKTREEANLLFGIYDSYIRQNTPEYVDAAQDHAKAVVRELTKTWPNWGKAEEARNLKARKEARIRGVAFAQSSKKWTLVVINVAVIAALALVLIMRRKRSAAEK